jgi:D-alanyl-D-alanine carboxypeptidase/D-alanyl-D-alanine-endopeptidase (penicillin-binding protein 4)
MVPLGAPPVRRAISVWEPTAYAVAVLGAALARAGIVVEQSTLIGPTPPFAREIAALESVTLAELAVPLLKLSNNGIAEILVKTLGRRVFDEGSWEAGMRAVGDYLAGIGIDPSGLRLRDGSGLTRLNLATAGAFAALLVAVRSAPWFPLFYAALPVAGAPDRLVGGTLRSRMVGTRAEGSVRAKTGTLTGVSALSGYAGGEGAAPLVFSIIFNNVLGPAPRDIEDRIAAILAGAPPSSQARTRPALGLGRGVSAFSSSPRRGSNRGGSDRRSPRCSRGSSVAKPGPAVAISNRTPLISRK